MHHVTSADGTAIAFDREGAGPPLVLVAGALQQRAGDPRTGELIRLLAERFTVVNYDRRGRGDSGDTPPYSSAREIEDLEAVIDAVGAPAFVFGMSSGGVLALDAAAGGVPVRALAIYEPSLLVDGSRPPVPEDYVAQLESRVAAGRRGDAVEYFMTTAVGMPPEMVGQMRSAPFWAGMEAVAHTLPHDGAFTGELMRGRPLPADRWAAVTVPVLVVDGGDSPVYQRNADQALVELLPNAEHRTLEGQTHAVAPDALAPLLEEFFASLRGVR